MGFGVAGLWKKSKPQPRFPNQRNQPGELRYSSDDEGWKLTFSFFFFLVKRGKGKVGGNIKDKVHGARRERSNF